jgi:hypothetical protein
MIKGQEGNEGGFGISPYMGDNEHKIIVVDCGKQEIGFAKEGDEPDCLVRWSFKNFCALPVMELNAEYLHIA